MASKDVNESTSASYYAGLPHETRATLADEMFAEICDHNDGLSALLNAVLDRATKLEERDPILRQLSTVALSWANDADHAAQISRLRGCLSTMKTAPIAVEA